MSSKGKTNKQKESIETKYKLGEMIGEGGNAKVFAVIPLNSQELLALKYLSVRSEEKEQRFHDEVKIMKDNASISGIMPILDFNLDNYWYVMPIATPIMKWSNDMRTKCTEDPYKINKIDYSSWITTVIKGFIDLTETLGKLHDLGIHHRDIKPDNIYYYKERLCFGDFGLVEFPDNNNNFTRNDKGLGAIFTIAPEMKRNPKGADGSKADVYSLAKTLWMILSDDEKGFDGQYSSIDHTHGLRFYDHLKNEYLVEIEELLYQGTTNDPKARPNIKQFGNYLSQWLSSYSDRLKKELNEWRFVANRIFRDDVPVRTEYQDPTTIVRVLNVLASSSAMNHMLLPESGGLDFSYADIAPEAGFIYIYTKGGINVIKPKALYFESFQDSRWNYFFIEAENVEPIDGVPVSRFGDQLLVEDTHGHYVKADDAVYGVYDYDSGLPLPIDYKIVNRFTQGKFLIVMKISPYNHIPSTYDGRHAMMSNEELRNYFERMQKEIAYGVSKGYKEEEILNMHEFGDHPYPERQPNLCLQINVDEKKLPKPDDFIKESFKLWDFSEFIQEQKENGNIAFCFKFKFGSYISWLYNLGWYLCSDGMIREGNDESIEKYQVYDRDVAISIVNDLNDSIQNKCKGFDISNLNIKCHFDIEFCLIGKPHHLFTKEEIENEMRNADDRRGNQLVIDEDGYAHVLPTDIRHNGSLYPVSNESWGAYNNYVGKYSSLDTLDETYRDMLACWLKYLKSGHHIHCDTNQCDNNIEDLLSEIIKLY